MKKFILTLLTLASAAHAELSVEKQVDTDNPISSLINSHLQQYGKQELFSAIQVSIKTKDKINTYTAGTLALKSHKAISATDLFNIGSITKSFTAALVVMAESEGKLNLNSPLGDYLPEYKHWHSLNLTSLLNMSTGLPNYSDSPKINFMFSKNIQEYWSPKELINLVYSKEFNPPLKPGFFYSNTGYVLLDMILSSKYNDSYINLLNEKIINPLNLQNSFYPVPTYPAKVMQRMVRGYSYNVYDNPELLGQDVTENNLSWAGAAGAIVANSEDVVHWVEHLFIDDQLLTKAQKTKMQQLVSTSTGKPISQTDKNQPHGFGLGIIQGYDEKIGHYWFYEGKTLGYRALYMYVPCNQVIISALFNSATNNENDRANDLVQALYSHLIKQDSSLVCEQKNTVA